MGRELLRRNPELPPERIGDVAFAATAQVGDQGLTLGRDVALLAGIPHSVPGFAVDRMCAGALTAVTAGAGEIALGEADVDAFAVRSQQRAAAAWENGVMRETVVPMSVFTDDGWRVADLDEFLRPETSMEGLAELPTPFRPGGRVTAGNSAGLTDGAAACLLASEQAAEKLGLQPRMRLVSFAFAGVEPHPIGLGARPA